MFPRFVGTFVRITPNHVSIADPAALKVIYAHGTGGLKGHFYDAIVSTRPNLFNTRNRAEHSRKRKMVSHIFSLKSVLEYEPYIRIHAEALLRQWGKLSEGGKGLSGREAEGWFGRDGGVRYNPLPCQLHPGCIRRRQIDLRLQGTLTSRSTLSVTSPSVPRSVCSRPEWMYSS